MYRNAFFVIFTRTFQWKVLILLHQIFNRKFYCLQIVAVILCNTGIALLAYMDGITGSPTLGGVVLATAAAAGSAVYKVST